MADHPVVAEKLEVGSLRNSRRRNLTIFVHAGGISTLGKLIES